MRVFVLGATGRVGGSFVDQALGHGHTITAFVRSPQNLEAAREGLSVVQGDVRDEQAIAAALPGHDAVVSALGPEGLGRTTIHQDAARATLAAMDATGTRRLVIVSAGIVFRNTGLVAGILRATLLRNVVEDSEAMERLVVASDPDWTILRPPQLTTGPLTGTYGVEDGSLPKGKRTISRADVAHFILSCVERGDHVRAIVGMAGR